MREISNVDGSIWGLIVADALGVPAEFKSREELRKHPIVDMIGYGTHEQPAGTWSDDSSMMLATLEWLNESEEDWNYEALMDKFSAWLVHGAYTPYGETFDSGITVSRALMKYERGMAPLSCGGITEMDNGNGSLMRILPISLYLRNKLLLKTIEDAYFIYDISGLTHAHARSKVACLIYSKIIADILFKNGGDKYNTIVNSLNSVYYYLNEVETDDFCKKEINTYRRLFSMENFAFYPLAEIKSTGYVVDTLEAAVWCFLNSESYQECVLKAVNLGEDTDTVGAVAGGMAGAYYGYESIPEQWLSQMPKKEWIAELVVDFKRKYCS